MGLHCFLISRGRRATGTAAATGNNIMFTAAGFTGVLQGLNLQLAEGQASRLSAGFGSQQTAAEVQCREDPAAKIQDLRNIGSRGGHTVPSIL